MTDHCCEHKGHELADFARRESQRRVLLIVLYINAAMFLVEFSAGVIAGSAALMADSVDMLGDALVYALSLYALDRGAIWKARAAVAKGGFILALGAAVLVEIGIKIATGSLPQTTVMLGIGALALTMNLTCLSLLWRFRRQDVNMSSTFECSRNDVIANIGVLVAAGLVAAFASPWPDIIVAVAIAGIFLRSAVRVLREAWPQLRVPINA